VDANPLQWWNEKKHHFERLFKCARCLLAIPASSVASESLFSVAKKYFTGSKSCTSAKLGEQLLLIGASIKVIGDDFHLFPDLQNELKRIYDLKKSQRGIDVEEEGDTHDEDFTVELENERPSLGIEEEEEY